MGRGRRRATPQAPRHFDPSALTASARNDTGTFNDDDLPMVLTHPRCANSFQHILQRETRREALHSASVPFEKPTEASGAENSTNPYLRAFLDSGIRRAFSSELALASWANKRTLKKEIIESMAALQKIGDELHRRQVPDDADLVFFDLCSGKGLLSILLSRNYPHSRIYSIDNNPRMVLTHLEATPNVDFRLMDLHSERTAELVESALHRNKAPSAICPIVVVLAGMHLCGALALRAVRLFQRASRQCLIETGVSGESPRCHLVLCPCCLPRKSKHSRVYGHDVGERAAGLGVPAYQYWCTQLYFELHGSTIGRSGRQSMASMLPDPSMSSDKSTFLTASA